MVSASSDGARPPVVPTGTHTALNAFAAVARKHGLHLSVEQLRRDHADGEGELSSRLLVTIGKRFDLVGRVARLRWSHLRRIGEAAPVILRLKDGKALILTGIQAVGADFVALIQDPMSENGLVIPVDELRLCEVWAGETVFFKTRRAPTAAQRRFDWLYIVAEVLRERHIFRDIAFIALMLSVFAIIPPLVYMMIVERVLVHQRESTLFVLLTGIVFFLFFETAFGFMRRRLLAIGTARIDARLNTMLMDRILRLTIDFFERTPTGMITYRAHEIWRVRGFLTGQVFGTMLDSIALLVIIPLLFVMSFPLALMVMAVAVVMTLVVIVYIRPMAASYGRVIEAEQQKSSLLVESIHGMRTVKSLALEGALRREWDTRVAEAARATMAFQLLANQPQTILFPLEKAIYVGSLAMGSWLVISGSATIQIGTLIAFTMLAQRATQPLIQIAQLMQQFQEIRGSIGMVQSVVDAPTEGRHGTGVRPVVEGNVTFSEVRFQYPGARTPALDGVDFQIRQGSIVGIMGRSGSGKTTVTRLLQGLNLEYDGLIKIDGVDLREIETAHLRANMGVVLQENFLFKGTIRENIIAARRDAPLSAVIRAARMAGAEEFIERLPRGYETMIEEGSANLSGGQRQRLAIARALLIEPPILILDEATSALDPESEAIVNANLRLIAKGRTVIVISHRLASLVDCDQILVMERGRVVDTGRHADLVERSDIYRHLWFQQNRHLTTPMAPHDRTIVPTAGRG
jgi:ATP-binding cassette, subfamily B, bacterial HlyB/CyaB